MIIDHLERKDGFWGEAEPVSYRLHLYFSNKQTDASSDRRLRLVVAPGEWFRYDFKSPPKEGDEGSIEASLKFQAPIPVARAVEALLPEVSDPADREAMSKFQGTPEIEIAMSGKHEKTHLFSEHFELEASFDDLPLMENGAFIREVEAATEVGTRG